MIPMFIKRWMCKLKGHNFESYEFRTGPYPLDIEEAGHCTRCGFDTHGDIKEYGGYGRV
ncbi:hypothetical protein [Enterococcus gilvus]|uniref:Uncharacterized protein n=1 Tax=Enterococcus gilvus ATCC BAA-350 TaxID=1158614 RepID=R2VB12_9ENTE|nr:hypothetical protein [Enterococcus gilvus]EOI54821.1 hypothetical protein UKC_02858 [Enterococcus gilvus ATCC BAA-350]EOW81803.1 hypothetical protein I592_01103 [Enterococcus gilvus ATCC BAA-350]